MENNYDNLDGKWDAMLKKLAAGAEIPSGPGEFRKARWMQALAEQTAKRHRRVVARWTGYAATAAVAVIAVSIALFAFRPAMTAQTAIASFDNTVAARPVVLMEASDFIYKHNAYRFKSYIDNSSGDMFTRLEVRSVVPEKQFLADICISSSRAGGNLYIKKLTKDNTDILANIGSPKGLMLPLALPSALSYGVVPQKLELSDIRGMVESLSNACEDFKVSGAGSDVIIEGIVTRPKLFDVKPLIDSFKMAGLAELAVPLLKADVSKIDPRLVRLINSTGPMLSDNESAGNAARKTMSAMTYLILIRQELAKLQTEQSILKKIPLQLQDAALGAKIKIDYDRDEKTIKNVTIDNFGPSKGIISLRFVTVEEFKTAAAAMNPQQ